MSFADMLEQQFAEDMRDPEYLRELLLWDLTEQIAVAMEEQGVSRADLAQRLGVSRQYVTKVLNGMPNLTLRTMVEIAAALGRQVRIGLEVPAQATPPRTQALTTEKPASMPRQRRAPASRKRAATTP